MKITETTKKTSELMKLLRKETSIYSYWDDKKLDDNFPVPEKSTTREFSDNLEPDVLGKSHDDFTKEYGDRMMTIREYIIEQTRRAKNKETMLDEKNWTFFRGRLPSGRVARGDWDPDLRYRRVRFDWGSADRVNADCGARLAIPLKSCDSLVPFAIDEAIKIVKEAGYQVSKIM